MTQENSVLYNREGRIAQITLNRPDRMNAISPDMPAALRAAVEEADRDDRVHIMILTGAGAHFCAGYDLKVLAETPRPTLGSQDMPWDPLADYALVKGYIDCYMSLWRSPKPVLAKLRGYCVGGGTDIALCADLVTMSQDARIGYPPARIWGCPSGAMWIYRLGLERAKRLLFTGDVIDGRQAARIGLVHEAVPEAELDDAVARLADRMAAIPRNQLAMQKLLVNQAYENMGLSTSQMFGVFFDGFSRHTPEGVAFKARCEQVGFRQAVAERDSGDPLRWRNAED